MSDKYVNVVKILEMKTDYAAQKSRIEQEMSALRNKLTELSSTLAAYNGAVTVLDALTAASGPIVQVEPSSTQTEEKSSENG